MKLGETVYLSWSWRGVLLWECPYAVIMCPVVWWESWIWSEHRSRLPPGCCGSYHLCGLQPAPGISKGLSYAQCPSPPYWGGGGSEVAGAEALRIRSELVPFPLSVHSPPSWQWHLHLRGKEHQTKRGQSRFLVQAGACAGMAMGNWPEPWVVSICFLHLVFWVSKHEWSLGFLQPSSKSCWFSNQLRGLVFLMLGLRAGVPNMYVEPLTPQGGSLSPWYPPPLLCLLLGVQVLTW